MGKGIKIILSILSAILLTLVLLPIFISLLLNLQFVQNFAARKANDWFSQKTQTEVRFDHLRLQLFNKVTVDGLYLGTRTGDTIIYAKNLVVPIQHVNLFTGKISLGEVVLRAPFFKLQQDSTGSNSFKEMLAKLKNPNPKKKFRMDASRLIVRDMHFMHSKYLSEEHEGGNFTDLEVEVRVLRLKDFSLVSDSLNFSLDSLSLRQKDGLEIHQLAVRHLVVAPSQIHLDQIDLQAPNSHLKMNYLYMDQGSWSNFKDFADRVPLRADIADSRIAAQMLGSFIPALREKTLVLEGLTASVEGTVADLTGELSQLRVGEATSLHLSFAVQGLPAIEHTRFDVNIASFTSQESDISMFVQQFTGKEIDPALRKRLATLGHIRYRGRLNGAPSHFRTEGRLGSDQGELFANLMVKPQVGKAIGFAGYLSTTKFNLGHLLGSKTVGRFSFRADLSGAFGAKVLRIKSKATINELDYNGYNYSGIEINGDVENKKFIGSITSADPNVDFDFKGNLNFNDSLPAYDFQLDMRNVDLYKLGFNRRDSVSLLKCRLKAVASGLRLDNMNGRATITDMTYINPVDTVRAGDIKFVAENNPTRKMLGIYSSIADLELQGKNSYRYMFAYFKNTLINYFPSISEPLPIAPKGGRGKGKITPKKPPHFLPPRADQQASSAASAAAQGAMVLDNYYALKVNIKEANNLAGIFSPGLRLARGTQLSFVFNPQSDIFNLTMNSDFIERGNFFISKLNLNSRNQSDSISLFLQSEDIFAGGVYMPNFSVVGAVRDNKINLAARFNNKDNGTYAMFSTTTTLRRDTLTGIPQAKIRFNPSRITSGDQTWQIFAREILYDSLRLSIDRLSIANGSQRMDITGVASRNQQDTIKMKFTNFDLAPLSHLTKAVGYKIEGKTNGYANFTSTQGQGVFTAKIDFDSLFVNNINIPNSTFESNWDLSERRIRFWLNDREGKDTFVKGYFDPALVQLHADATLKDINLAFLDPVMKEVLEASEGRADAVLRIDNPNKKIMINGAIGVKSFSTTVGYTKVPYTIKPTQVNIKDNVLSLHNGTVYDSEGHTAELDLDFDFSSFKNLKYDVRIKPEGLQVLATTMKDNDLFYGTVYGTGLATISGSKNKVKMDITASTAGNSRFFMPLSSASQISTADFVIFRDPNRRQQNPDSLVQISRRKQIMLEQQRNPRIINTAQMVINMAINVLPNAEMQLVIDPETGDIIKGRGQGGLNITVNPSAQIFNMNGNIGITQGNYRFTLRNLVTKDFTIRPGSSIQWTGDPLDATLNITAVYSLKASLEPLLAAQVGTSGGSYRSTPVNCVIHLSELLTSPTITFDVEVPNATPEVQGMIAYALNSQEAKATQFIYLLASRSFYSETGPDIGNVSATTGIDFLTNQLSTLLSTDRFSFVPKYTPGGGSTADEVGGAIYGELIKDRLILEADVSYNTGNAPTVKTAPVSGDATLSLLLDPTGNFRLRAFTRTVDRYGDQQGLQESGLGFTYREDFNNLKDLKQILRDRFHNIGQSSRDRKEEQIELHNQKLDSLRRLSPGEDTLSSSLLAPITPVPFSLPVSTVSSGKGGTALAFIDPFAEVNSAPAPIFPAPVAQKDSVGHTRRLSFMPQELDGVSLPPEGAQGREVALADSGGPQGGDSSQSTKSSAFLFVVPRAELYALEEEL